MPELNEEIDVAAWLDGAKRTERSVTVYARADLLADIDKLEAEKRTLASIPEDDRSLGDDEGRALQEQIDALYVQLDKSKMELRVTFLDDEEQDAIREAVKTDFKEAADKAATKARKEALVNCERTGIVSVNDKNDVVRRMALSAVNKVIEREVSLRTLTECLVSPKMTREQVGQMYGKIGEAQLALITAAYSRASNEAPEVQVPKLLTPSHSDETDTSS
jgi:hypothetical protein